MDTSEQLAINKLLAAVSEYKASDLHLSVGNPPVLRVNNRLMPLSGEAILTPQFLQNFVKALLNEEQQKRFVAEKQLVFTYTSQQRVRFKVTLFYQQGFVSASLKLVPTHIQSLMELGLPDAVERLAQLNKGLVIVSGPFGSGKTTTLAAFINYYNLHSAKRIVTLEKPVEYLYIDNKCVIDQREVGEDVADFETGLDFILQEDVDIVLLSELVGASMIKKVFDVLASGRLVYLAMNTDSCQHALEKIIQAFPNTEQQQIREQLVNYLQGVINQRIIINGQGQGAVAAEVLFMNQAVYSLIREGDLSQLYNVLQTSGHEGMQSLDQALAKLVQSGQIGQQEAAQAARDPRNFQALAGNNEQQ